MKNNKLVIFLIVILGVISISLVILMINLLNNNIKMPSFNFNNNISDKLIVDEVYEQALSKININSNASYIYINQSSDNVAKLVIYGDEENTKVDLTGNELNIRVKSKNCVGLCFNYSISKIELYLPSSYQGDLNITNNYGDIEIDDFKNANMNIKEDAGCVKIVSGNIINVKNNYGDISIDYANELTAKESAGDVVVGEVNYLAVKNSYGDIKVEKVNDYLDVENDCGDISLDEISLLRNSTIKMSLGDIKIGNTNEIYIDAETNLGKVKINNNYNKSDITLKIKNDCGDIKVSN